MKRAIPSLLILLATVLACGAPATVPPTAESTPAPTPSHDLSARLRGRNTWPPSAWRTRPG